jgi:hypothetical protein
MKILFHGASVTEQEGESSYVFQLNEQLKKTDNQHIILKKGFGGCHINDAGLLNIAVDADEEIDICFLEWNTTGLDRFEEGTLRYMAATLIDKGILPIFLILARADSISLDSRRLSEKQVLNFCIENGIPYLDYRGLINPELDLRDVVHTNFSGAVKYAKALFKDLTYFSEKINIISNLKKITSDIQVNSLEDFSIDVVEGGEFQVTLENVEKYAQLIIGVVKGPSSPIIYNGKHEICVWDKWSHYERPGYESLLGGLVPDYQAMLKIKIKVLSKSIDYSACTREFSYEGTKVLKVRGLYGINSSILKVDSL